MSQSRRIALLLIVVVGGIIVGAALLAPPRPSSSPRLSAPPPSPLGLVPVAVTSTPGPTSAPTEISPTPHVNLTATPIALLVSQPTVAYPAPAQSETLAPASVTPSAAGASEGRLAPEFDLVRENGARVSLSDYRGKETVVLIFFRGQT